MVTVSLGVDQTVGAGTVWTSAAPNPSGVKAARAGPRWNFNFKQVGRIVQVRDAGFAGQALR